MFGTNFIPGGGTGKRVGSSALSFADDAGRNIFYHGTSVGSAISFLKGEALDASKAAANKIDGSAGFYLATNADDAAFFAVRRGQGTVLAYEFTDNALNQLNNCRLVCRPIPAGNTTRFSGYEIVVPPEAFNTFNRLRDAGEITVRPFNF